MTIQELVDAVVARYPDLCVEVDDHVKYQAGKPPERRVSARVSSTQRGRGVAQDIVFEMDDKIPEWVSEIDVPHSMTYWQAGPLKDALREGISAELHRHAGKTCPV